MTAATTDALSPSDRRMSLVAILSTVSAFAVGLGLTLPLLALILERRGYAGSVNGLNLATAGLASICSAPFVPRALHRFGTAPFLIACLVAGAVTLIALYALPSIWLFFPLRFLLSCSLNSLFVVSEFWINQLATESNRGRYIALYGACTAGGFGIGPAILAVMGTHGIAPFVCGSAMLLAAVVPVIVARRAAPLHTEHGETSVLGSIRLAPAALLAALVFGALDGGMWGLRPVYAVRSGYPESAAALAITAMSLGGLAFQYPLGQLADRVDRRKLLVACSSAGVAGAILTPFLISIPAATYVLVFLWGGMVMGIYTIGLTLLGERFKGAELANANAAYVMLYSTGLLVGPAVEGIGLDAWNPHGLLLVLGAIGLIYVGFLLFRAPSRGAAAT